MWNKVGIGHKQDIFHMWPTGGPHIACTSHIFLEIYSRDILCIHVYRNCMAVCGKLLG